MNEEDRVCLDVMVNDEDMFTRLADRAKSAICMDHKKLYRCPLGDPIYLVILT